MSGAATLHAGAVALDDAGLLIRGAAGAGKSTLARALVAHWTARGRFARLVADDRVVLQHASGRVIARVPDAIAGLVEVRDVGILRADHLAAVRLTLVVDLVLGAARMPEAPDEHALLEGVVLPRLALAQDNIVAAVLAVAAILASDGSMRRTG